jgi:hypothetical protein
VTHPAWKQKQTQEKKIKTNHHPNHCVTDCTYFIF